MKDTHTGALRHAIAVVAPEVPKLATELPQDELAILNALAVSLKSIEADDSVASEADANKAERSAIASFFIGEQRKVLLKGEGRKARFQEIYPSRVMSRILGVVPSRDFRNFRFVPDMRSTLSFGAAAVEEAFTTGDDQEHQIWPILKDRYDTLGHRALQLVGHRGMSREGVKLQWALRTKALGQSVYNLISFTNEHVAEKGSRLEAAHDLSCVVLDRARVHATEFNKAGSLLMLDVAVAQDEEAAYRLAGLPSNRDEVFPRIDPDELPNSAFGCPAGLGGQGDLDAFVHAAINAAPAYHLL